MRRVDARVYVIAALAILAVMLGAYRSMHPDRRTGHAPDAPASFDASVERVRAIIDTSAQLCGAPKRYIGRRAAADSGSVMLETTIGVPGTFDELRLISVLTDSLRASGCTVTAAKNLKEHTTTIRFMNRDHLCIYRCILYRKEIHH